MAERRKSSRQSGEALDQTREAAEPLTVLNEAARQVWLKSNDAVAKGAAEMNDELIAYARRCLGGALDGDPPMAAWNGRWDDMVRRQGEIGAIMAQEYLSEVAKLMDLANRTMQTAAAPWIEFYTRSVPEAFRARTP